MLKGLIPVTEAIKRILSDFSVLNTETVGLSSGEDRVLASDLHAAIDLPPFDNSAMDGFVLRAEDTTSASPKRPTRFNVMADITAGYQPDTLIKQGEAARIVTGAMIPSGGNAVVPVEDTNILESQPGSNQPEEVYIDHPIKCGENIRPKGQYLKIGAPLIKKGDQIRPQHIGILASQGFSKIPVYRRPQIGIFSTGTELLAVGDPYSAGKIYDSNSIMMEALLHSNGCDHVRLGTPADDPEQIKTCLDELLDRGVDLIISSAGVSMGAHDYVRYVIEKYGDVKLWRVNMRPGKPLLYGTYRQIPFIGLPGNPVSAYIGFIIFVRPVLRKMGGLQQEDLFSHHVYLAEAITSDGRESYLRAALNKTDGRWWAKLTGDQGSGNLISLLEAEVLLKIPQDTRHLPAETSVEACFLSDI